MQNKFDEDYFENGIITGKSCYVNYRWISELTIKMAHKLIIYLGLKTSDSLLDFGCAKGYLVKALRILEIEAYGCDISEYAINNIDHEVAKYCYLNNQNCLPFEQTFDWIISKDVLEHLEEELIDEFLLLARQRTNQMFHVVPLGDEKGNFIISAYNSDDTHIQKKPLDWWIEKFRLHGWTNISYTFRVPGVKDNWTKEYPKGNAFFTVKKTRY